MKRWCFGLQCTWMDSFVLFHWHFRRLCAKRHLRPFHVCSFVIAFLRRPKICFRSEKKIPTNCTSTRSRHIDKISHIWKLKCDCVRSRINLITQRFNTIFFICNLKWLHCVFPCVCVLWPVLVTTNPLCVSIECIQNGLQFERSTPCALLNKYDYYAYVHLSSSTRSPKPQHQNGGRGWDDHELHRTE